MGIAERRKRERLMRQKMIQEAALELFIKKGFYSVKMEDISERAELSIATLYLYFKSKDDLYASLIEIALQYLHDQIQAIFASKSLDPKAKILGFKEGLYKTYQLHPTIFRIIFHVQLYDTLTSIDPKILDRLNGTTQKIMRMIADTYKAGVRQGKFKYVNTTAIVDILWATFAGLVLWEDSKQKLDPNKNFLKATLDQAFKLFINGALKDKQREVVIDRQRVKNLRIRRGSKDH
ncbi:MAG: TetR/AcrR family transcriptional regulator [Desulfobacterales bacterium]|nr:TetR/AcrR family transcriptional regulator [Desulfobacterales bacterium]